jgi:hypothetical protein
MGYTRVVALTLTAAAFAVSGCGGSSSSGSATKSTTSSNSAGNGGTSKTLTRAELIARADVICARVNARLAANVVTYQREIPRAASQLASLERVSLVEFRKLEPPAELAADWKQLIADAQTLAAETVEYGESAKPGKSKNERGLVESSEATRRQAITIAKRDGFVACAQGV